MDTPLFKLALTFLWWQRLARLASKPRYDLWWRGDEVKNPQWTA
jgi:hypothetical protein